MQSFDDLNADEAADFFSNLGNKEQSAPARAAPEVSQAPSQGDIQPNTHLNIVQETVSRNINWDEGTEGIIKQNLLHGEIEYAAQVALKCGRSTEALLIAEAGGPDLFAQIKEEYFKSHKDQFVREIIQAISTDDFTSVIESVTQSNINKQPVCSWKEILAYVIAYEDEDKLRSVAKDLGDKLLKQNKDINSAIICYIISKELSIVTDLWKKRALYQIRKLGLEKNEALFHLF